MERRVQIGAEKRARTRQKLLEAAYRLFAVHGADAPTIDDVIAEARTGRGTFYNHFNTRDELFRAVADDVATAMGRVIIEANSGVKDPALRVVTAFRHFVRFAIEDETRGWILLRTMPLVGPPNETMKGFIYREFEAAISSGRLHAKSTMAAIDLGLGLQLMTVRRILVDRAGREYIDEAAEVMLTAFGVDAQEARDLANAPLPGTCTLDVRS